MRSATIERKTAETAISLMLSLDGAGKGDIQTGCGFLDHMLTLLAAHARFDLLVRCTGDTQVDDHHTVEDIGIALGQALRAALGDKRGVRRYGQRLLPMDEALALVAVDLSGRGCLGFDVPKRAGERIEVAHPVIHHGDHGAIPPSVPLVEGISPAAAGSISQASRRARATALKTPSMM